MIRKKPNITLINFPITVKSGYIPLSNILTILMPLSNELFLITGKVNNDILNEKILEDKVHLFEIEHQSGSNVLIRIIKYITAQIKISINLFKVIRNIDIIFFFIGGEQLVLPLLISKLFNKKTLILLAGDPGRIGEINKDKFQFVLHYLSKINLYLTDKILVYSNIIVKKRKLEAYKNKISIAPEHYLDFDKFFMKKNLNSRENYVGFFGDFGKVKGIMNLIEALPQILREKPDLKFLIGGAGTLKEDIEDYLHKNTLENNVELLGWVDHDNLPKYLNELKLLILPSYTEGLPNIVLESMACGTPVLVTPVGALPDFILNEKTGFIMENNSPECISKNLFKALNHPNLLEISGDAQNFVKDRFGFENVLNNYNKIIKEL